MDKDTTQKVAGNLYKTLKEDFYANLSGGTISEINLVTAIAVTGYILFSVLQTKRHLFSRIAYGPSEFILDSLINIGGLLLAITLYASTPWVLHVGFLVPAMVTYLTDDSGSHKRVRKPRDKSIQDKIKVKETTENPSKDGMTLDEYLPRKAFLTTYRGGMLVITCLAILAVDFRVFPRRFAKVETWGTSMITSLTNEVVKMDLGVGSFVFSSGLVSARTLLKNEYLKKTDTLMQRFVKSFRSTIALLVMGFVRLAVTKGVDYHEHITEYGAHWNFFFTLSFLPPFTAIFHSLYHYLPTSASSFPSPSAQTSSIKSSIKNIIISLLPCLPSIILSTLYELLLSQTSLKSYILLAPRTNLIAANKEGIFSFIGYLSIFLAGQSLGLSVLRGSKNNNNNNNNDNYNHTTATMTKSVIAQASLWTMLFIVATGFGYGFNISVSRRLANLPYVFWVCAYNCWQVLGFWMVEMFFFGGNNGGEGGGGTSTFSYEERTPRTLRAFNKNGLVVFLVANLLTGLANKSVDTLAMTTLQSMSILILYALALTFFAVGLDMKGITIKF